MRTKYVLVDRGTEYHNTAVTREVAEHMLTKGTIKGYSPITLTEIKAKRIHIYRADDYAQHQREDALYDQYNDKKFTAEVRWFDNSSGKGMVRIIETGDTFPLYACNIAGRKTWYPETACVSYEPKQVVDVECKVFAGGEVFVNGLTQGNLDESKWNSLDQSRLAFKCDENGQALNGLFK